SAKPTSSTVLINGEKVPFGAYNISDSNYFKLRDLAFALNGTEKQFSVEYDEAANVITLTSGAAYTPVGGEMQGAGTGAKAPYPTGSKVTLDGKEVGFTAYAIAGNNYFKLRDIGVAFDFGVNWDGAKNSIVIDTSKAYTPDNGTITIAGREISIDAATLNLDTHHNITDITPLRYLTKLTRLQLASNKISDLTPLKSLTELSELFLTYNSISDVTPLQSLTKLTTLYLDHNNISDVAPLQSLTNLTMLNLGSNSISDIAPLQSLTELGLLCLDNNIILSDITPLQSMTDMQKLYLNNNNISDITPLKPMTKLRWLWLGENNIRDVTLLKSLTNLEWLNLVGNPLTPQQINDLQRALPRCKIEF
ncbi:MAG: leucine-rich repeat domain-containing protein, partial [Oscillospiraceae bacterium]|nr:leucine-rich repeat domain-containing protein [Oscillospiraceae bacterium]